MPRTLYVVVIGLLGCIFTLPAPAQVTPLTIGGDREAYPLDAHIEVLRDPGGELTIREVTRPPSSEEFAPSRDGIGRPADEETSYWIRLRVRPEEAAPTSWVVEANTSRAEAYVRRGDAYVLIDETGYRVPMADRAVWRGRPSYLLLPLAPNELQTIYLRIQYSFDDYFTEGRPIRLSLQNAQAFEQKDHTQRFFQGGFAGLMLAMALYNLFLYLSIRDRSYLYYVVMVLAVGAFWMTGYGYTLDVLWPRSWVPYAELDFYVLQVAVVAYILFTRSFLNLRRYAPRLYELLSALTAGFAVAVGLGLLDQWLAAQYTAAVLSLVTLLVTLAAGIQSYRKGYRPAGFFLLASGILILGGIIYILAWFQLLPVTPVTRYSVQYGSALEAILLSLALADRIKLLQREKHHAVEQKRHAEAVSKALREANELKTHLLDIASHDLRSPLTTILGFSSVLQEELDDHDDLQEAIDAIAHAARHMQHLVDDLLDTAVLEHGQVELHAQPVDAARVAESVVRVYKDRAAAKRQQLEFHTRDDTSYVVEADETRLTEALDNLVSNAVKFTPLEKRICVSVSRRNGTVRIAVHDEGPGLTAEDRRNLFARFQRLSAKPTGNEPSTGLGLSITKRLVEMHGGRIWAESEPGQGSTFIVEMPALSADEDA